MNTLKMLLSFAKDRRGVTALEYGLIAALIAVVIVGTVTNVGTSLKSLFNTVAGEVSSASSASGSGQ